MTANGLTTTVAGRYGEHVAANYLIKNGYRVLEMNYHYSHREIDIIAEDDMRVIFVEVKSRTANERNQARFGRPAAAVTVQKQKLLISAAQQYIRTHNISKRCRLDVIEIYFKSVPTGLPEIEKIKHIENAFGVS